MASEALPGRFPPPYPPLELSGSRLARLPLHPKPKPHQAWDDSDGTNGENLYASPDIAHLETAPDLGSLDHWPLSHALSLAPWSIKYLPLLRESLSISLLKSDNLCRRSTLQPLHKIMLYSRWQSRLIGIKTQ